MVSEELKPNVRENLKNHGFLRKRLARILPYKIKMRRIYNKKFNKWENNEIHGFRGFPNKESYARGITDPRPEGVLGGWYPHIHIEGSWSPIFITDNLNRSEYSHPPELPKYLFVLKEKRRKGKGKQLTVVFISIEEYLFKGGENGKPRNS